MNSMFIACNPLAISSLILCIWSSFMHLLTANVLDDRGVGAKVSQLTANKTPWWRWWRWGWGLACSRLLKYLFSQRTHPKPKPKANKTTAPLRPRQASACRPTHQTRLVVPIPTSGFSFRLSRVLEKMKLQRMLIYWVKIQGQKTNQQMDTPGRQERHHRIRPAVPRDI